MSCAGLAAEAHTPEIALAWVSCEQSAGRTASAWTALQHALALARNGRSDLVKPLEEQAAALARKLVKLRIERGTDIIQDGVLVLRDGVGLEATDIGRDVPVDPGTHVIIVAAPDRLSWSATVAAVEPGRTYEVQYPFLNEAAPTPGAAEARRTRDFLQGVGGCALALIGFGAGIGLTVQAIDESHQRAAFQCTGTADVCKQARNMLPNPEATAVGAGFGYAIGALGAGVAIGMFLRSEEPSKPVGPTSKQAVSFQLAPWIGPQGGGLGLSGRF